MVKEKNTKSKIIFNRTKGEYKKWEGKQKARERKLYLRVIGFNYFLRKASPVLFLLEKFIQYEELHRNWFHTGANIFFTLESCSEQLFPRTNPCYI